MIDPTVEAAPVKDVAAIAQPSDVVVAGELVEAHSADLRRVHLHRHKVRELEDGEEFADCFGRNGVGFRGEFGPELLVEPVLQIVGYELGPTERTGPVVVVHPRVDAAPVEDMVAVDQIPDLIVSVKLVKTHRAALGRVDQIRELHHRQELPDQHRGQGEAFGSGLPRNVWLQKIGETQKSEQQ
ncbi:hypothetical protein LOK49_LG13G01123 [Camellia lanceoleosa]|uniref:Uncharacterized protein n=1 Tax=Camellia lanceoleosa TaxID=1840588 RepID=A0ACC0FMW3_9ERIC|nr:hypothetical protein LOK49_LG13G01123 [Camellia lanceoleosa]